MDESIVKSKTSEYFVNELIAARPVDHSEREFLYEAAQKGDEQLLEAMRCVFGTHAAACMLDAAQNSCERAEFILLELELAEGEVDAEWERNLALISECVEACDCALRFAQRSAPELRAPLAALARRAGEAHKAAIRQTALLTRMRRRADGEQRLKLLV